MSLLHFDRFAVELLGLLDSSKRRLGVTKAVVALCGFWVVFSEKSNPHVKCFLEMQFGFLAFQR
jgi:hypothetical protein